MSLRRFFLTGPLVGAAPSARVGLPLSERDVHHLRDVLRARLGDEFAAVEPGGRAWLVRLVAMEGESAEAEVVLELPASPRSPRVTLFQGLPKGPKTDLIVEKAVELGVEAVIPLVLERSIVQLDERKANDRAGRWRKIAEAAAKQSERAFVPRVAVPMTLAAAEAELVAVDHLLVAWEDADCAPSIGEALAARGVEPGDSVGVVVGPEGGIAPGELERLCALGAATVSLGDTVLRTETAGMIAVALVVYEMGGLGGRRTGARCD